MDYKVKLQLSNRATTWLERNLLSETEIFKSLYHTNSSPLPSPQQEKNGRKKEKLLVNLAIHIPKQICMVFPSRSYLYPALLKQLIRKALQHQKYSIIRKSQ